MTKSYSYSYIHVYCFRFLALYLQNCVTGKISFFNYTISAGYLFYPLTGCCDIESNLSRLKKKTIVFQQKKNTLIAL